MNDMGDEWVLVDGIDMVKGIPVIFGRVHPSVTRVIGTCGARC
jgi:hypothetical protein